MLERYCININLINFKLNTKELDVTAFKHILITGGAPKQDKGSKNPDFSSHSFQPLTFQNMPFFFFYRLESIKYSQIIFTLDKFDNQSTQQWQKQNK